MEQSTLIVGEVQKGEGVAGRVFQLPTANLYINAIDELREGSYAAIARVADRDWPSIAYVSHRLPQKIEVHLFGYEGDLVGTTLQVQVKQFLAPPVAWKSDEQMKRKIDADVRLVQDFFNTHK